MSGSSERTGFRAAAVSLSCFVLLMAGCEWSRIDAEIEGVHRASRSARGRLVIERQVPPCDSTPPAFSPSPFQP